MATRFHLNSDTAPDVSPAIQTYTHSNETTTPKRKLLTTDTSALSTRAYAPDGADHLVAGNALLGQFVSDPMNSGITFSNGGTIVFAVQCLESNAGNNQAMRIWAGIYTQDGSTLQRELRAVISEGTELATSLTGRHLSTSQSGTNYTTVSGDRLVVEFSCTGTPTAAGGVQGHNASLRIGGNGAGGDVTADDLDTGTTKNGWVEFAPTITFQGGPVTLVVQDATHSHAADNIVLTQHNVLAVQDATHAHAADNLALTQHNVLVVQEASHAHSADNLVLTAHDPGTPIVVQDAVHAHSADNVVLTQHQVLVVQDGGHAHAADNIVLTLGGGEEEEDPSPMAFAARMRNRNSSEFREHWGRHLRPRAHKH